MARQSSGRPEPVERLIDEFSRLPGIGRRSAERLAFHVLKTPAESALRLAQAIEDVKRDVQHCSVCFNLTEVDPCRICSSPQRDASVVLVVEQPKDLLALEQTGMFRGVYHVLTGRIDPLGGVEPDHLTIPQLVKRVDDPAANSGGVAVREIILGLNPDLEGDSTTLYLSELFSGRRLAEGRSLSVSRLARGLPSGSQLEFASKAVLADAIECRQKIEEGSGGSTGRGGGSV